MREITAQRGISNIFITNLVLLAPVLLILKRWPPPFGSITLLYSGIGVLMASVTGFFYLSLLLVPVVAGLVADWLVGALNLGPRRPERLRVFATILPVVVWSLYFAAVAVQWGVAWSVGLWAGVILWTGAGGLGLSLLAFPGGSAQPRA